MGIETATVAVFAVEEPALNRHSSAVSPGVESAVRAAGGFPTQGGGVRPIAGAAAVAVRAVSGSASARAAAAGGRL
jgi:hypothetical protein